MHLALWTWKFKNVSVSGRNWSMVLHKNINLTFRSPRIVSIFLLIYFQQEATLRSLFISGRLLYMFWVVSSPIIRSTQDSIYSIWYVSGGISTHHQEHTQEYLQYLVRVKWLLLPAAIAAGSSNGLTSTRYCKYACVCSWWWVEIPPKTCRAIFQK